ERRQHWLGVLEQRRMPVVCIAAKKTVEILEAQADRPLVERPCRTLLPVRNQMVLAEPRGVVAVVYKNVADRAGTPRNDGVIAGIAGGKFRDVAEADAVMVASGEQRRSRRRTQGGRVELVVANPALVNSIKVWRRDRPPEGACSAEAGVVGQDQQHIRSARRRV